MPKFTAKELSSLKDIVSSHQIIASKLSSYANQCQDQDIKQMFKSAASEATQSAQNLIQMLN